MKLKVLLEAKSTTIYHGDNAGTKKLEAKLMNNGNNQEGIGIYFGSLETAKSYGKYLVSATVDSTKFINSRGDVGKELNLLSVKLFLSELHKLDREPLYYALTDWGKEIMKPEDVTKSDINFLAKQYLDEEVRNFQIDMADKFGVVAFVETWNRVFRHIHGTYNKDLDWYCIINTKQIVTPINSKK
jgi:hypothetical protein